MVSNHLTWSGNMNRNGWVKPVKIVDVYKQGGGGEDCGYFED